MRIEVEQLGKKFQREWIFRNVSLTLKQGQPCAFTGPNGSGKSTFLLMLAGLMPPTVGKVTYFQQDKALEEETVYQQVSIAAPYVELVEEFTLQEFLEFHTALKPLQSGMTVSALLERMYLSEARHKYIHQFSSGMKQRLKLGISFYAQNPVLLLDEPCSNLDQQGIHWYQEEVRRLIKDKLVVICSNQPYEYDFCQQVVDIVQYKR